MFTCVAFAGRATMTQRGGGGHRKVCRDTCRDMGKLLLNCRIFTQYYHSIVLSIGKLIKLIENCEHTKKNPTSVFIWCSLVVTPPTPLPTSPRTPPRRTGRRAGGGGIFHLPFWPCVNIAYRILCCVALCCVLCCFGLWCVVVCCVDFLLCYLVFCCVVFLLCCVVLCCVMLCCVVLCCVVLCCVVLCCVVA